MLHCAKKCIYLIFQIWDVHVEGSKGQYVIKRFPSHTNVELVDSKNS